MNIVREVRAVEDLFKTLEKDIEELKEQTGIHCEKNCVKCCTSAHIMATTIEFYPLAYYLYKNHLSDSILSKINKIHNPTVCPVINRFSNKGSKQGCSFYQYRGLICRLFAYSYHTDKHNNRLISPCHNIKIDQAKELKKADEILHDKPIGPKATDYYQQLDFINFNETQKLYPIGDAIRIAIEEVITYFHYKEGRAM